MTSIKHLLWQDTPKPKRDFIKENAKRFKSPRKSSEELDDQRKKSQNTSAKHTNRIIKSSLSQQNSANNKVRITAVPHGTLSHRRPLRAFPIKSSEQSETLYDKEKHMVSIIPKIKIGSPKAFRNQACQTLKDKELDHLGHDGVIRYPRSQYKESEEVKCPGKVKTFREMGLQTEDLVLHSPEKAAGDLMEQNRTRNKGSVDFIKLNLTAPLKPKQINTDKEDPIRAPSTYQKGVLPKYLREQKKDKENEKEERRDVLEGGITCQMLLPDDMRKKLLIKLKQDHKELVDQLNLLPFSVNSLKTLQRKQQIEKELDILEKRISNFSREKVFIRDA